MSESGIPIVTDTPKAWLFKSYIHPIESQSGPSAPDAIASYKPRARACPCARADGRNPNGSRATERRAGVSGGGI